jgi:hypothetical protein
LNLSAAALRLMAEKGLSLCDVAEIVAANETRDPTNAQRQARHRAKRAQSNGVTVTGVTPDIGSNDRDILTSHESKIPSPKGEVKKADRAFAFRSIGSLNRLSGKPQRWSLAWQPGAMERELAKFKNYWLAKGANAARTDWQRTWVNWLISADERKPRQHERSNNPTAEAVQRVSGFGAG